MACSLGGSPFECFEESSSCMAFLDMFNFDREFFVPNIPMHIARSPKERSQVQPKGSQGRPSESGRRVHSQETLQGYSRLLDSMRIPNLNRGQDTRANRSRHTTRSSTQPHAKQQLTNATQTQLTFTRTHTSPGRPHRRRDHRRCSPRRDRDAVRVARRSARRGVLRPHSLRRVAQATTSFFTHHLRLISLAAVIGAALPVAIWAKFQKISPP